MKQRTVSHFHLTYGELLLLLRRRHTPTVSVAAAAKHFGVWDERYRAAEHDRADADFLHRYPPEHMVPLLSAVTLGEFCFLLRRRMAWTAPVLAKKKGVSRITIHKMEHDATLSTDQLAHWWVKRGVPPAAATTLYRKPLLKPVERA